MHILSALMHISFFTYSKSHQHIYTQQDSVTADVNKVKRSLRCSSDSRNMPLLMTPVK